MIQIPWYQLFIGFTTGLEYASWKEAFGIEKLLIDPSQVQSVYKAGFGYSVIFKHHGFLRSLHVSKKTAVEFLKKNKKLSLQTRSLRLLVTQLKMALIVPGMAILIWILMILASIRPFHYLMSQAPFIATNFLNIISWLLPVIILFLYKWMQNTKKDFRYTSALGIFLLNAFLFQIEQTAIVRELVSLKLPATSDRK